MERGVPHLELKPDVCWQLSLRREDEVADDGYVTSVIRQWDRRDWGAGGAEFHWWCTEAPDAFVGTKPVYEELGPELVALSGRKIYKRLVRYLQARAGRSSAAAAANGARGAPADTPVTTGTASTKTVVPVAVPLPHPAVRRR
jgi:hypothetical protein